MGGFVDAITLWYRFKTSFRHLWVLGGTVSAGDLTEAKERPVDGVIGSWTAAPRGSGARTRSRSQPRIVRKIDVQVFFQILFQRNPFLRVIGNLAAPCADRRQAGRQLEPG